MLRPVRLSLLVAFLAACAWPLDISKLRPEGYVSDFARVIDGASKQALEQYCKRVEASTGAQIALVTLPTLEGEPIEDVANQLYRAWGVGRKDANEGVLLLLVIQDRRSRLEVGYGLEGIMPDGFAGGLLREMRPALRANRYGEAMAVAAQQIGDRIAQEKGARIDPLPVERRSTRRPGAEFPWPTMIGALALVLWVVASNRRRRNFRRPGFSSGGDFLIGSILGSLLGGMHGGGHHGRSRGGFGGFDSSDGFGGFGGGDSGGGGASSSW